MLVRLMIIMNNVNYLKLHWTFWLTVFKGNVFYEFMYHKLSNLLELLLGRWFTADSRQTTADSSQLKNL